MQSCLAGALPQAVTQSLSSINAQAQPQVQTQGVSAESVAAAVAVALAAQKDKKETKEPFPWDSFLASIETEATNAVALELIKVLRPPLTSRALS